MKKVILFLALIINVLCVLGQETAKQKFYVGTYTSEGARGIYLCNFDNVTGAISLLDTFEGIDNPSFLKISKDKRFLYSVTENQEGYVEAFQIDKNGKLIFINKQISNGSGPCQVDVSGDGKFVAVANYGGGSTALFKVAENGSLLPACSVIKNSGSGVNKSRQNKPHAHSIKFSPFNNQVFSADLGTDQLNIYTLENDELNLKDQKYVKPEPGSGPRHFEFYPDGEAIFVINELSSTIATFKNKGGKWEIFQTISTLPAEFKGVSYCADIHISSDGKFLYGSNRGHNSIAVFNIEKETKTLKAVGYVSVEGNWPRNFAISADGNFLLVANQKSGNITVFKINKETGMPLFTGEEVKIPAPVCIEFL